MRIYKTTTSFKRGKKWRLWTIQWTSTKSEARKEGKKLADLSKKMGHREADYQYKIEALDIPRTKPGIIKILNQNAFPPETVSKNR